MNSSTCKLCGHPAHETISPYPEDSECGYAENEEDAYPDRCRCRAGKIGFDWPKRCCRD